MTQTKPAKRSPAKSSKTTLSTTYERMRKHETLLCVAQSTQMSVQAYFMPGPYDLQVVCSIPNGTVTVNLSQDTDHDFTVDEFGMATLTVVRRFTTNLNRYF